MHVSQHVLAPQTPVYMYRTRGFLYAENGVSRKASTYNGTRALARGSKLLQQPSPILPARKSGLRPARRGMLFVGGLSLYCFACYGTYLYVTLGGPLARHSNELNIPEDVSDRYNQTAKTFDNEVDTMEKFMLMGWLRRSLTRRAAGHVLEVSVGTGRNVRYYDLKKCKSITMVDQSAEMIDIARDKFDGMVSDHPLPDTATLYRERFLDKY